MKMENSIPENYPITKKDLDEYLTKLKAEDERWLQLYSDLKENYTNLKQKSKELNVIPYENRKKYLTFEDTQFLLQRPDYGNIVKIAEDMKQSLLALANKKEEIRQKNDTIKNVIKEKMNAIIFNITNNIPEV